MGLSRVPVGGRDIRELLQEKPSPVRRCLPACLYLQERVHSMASIAPAIPNSLLTSLVDMLFKPTQTLNDFTIQPGDKWSLAGYIQKG